MNERYDGSTRLEALTRAVTGPPSASELRGEQAVLAAYRRESGRGRGGLRLVSATGMTAAASALVLSMTVMTAAAYTSALPRGIQHAVHRVLHRIGVPDVEARRHPAPAAAPTQHRATVRRPTPVLELRAAATEAVGARVVVELLSTGVGPSHPVAGLVGRVPGALRWSPLGTAALDSAGHATLTLPHLPHTLQLRWQLSPAQAPPLLSPVVTVRARPVLHDAVTRTPSPSSLTFSVTTGAEQRGRQVLLQELVHGRWVDVAATAVDRAGAARFPLGSGRRAAATYRSLLPENRLFAASTGEAVSVR